MNRIEFFMLLQTKELNGFRRKELLTPQMREEKEKSKPNKTVFAFPSRSYSRVFVISYPDSTFLISQLKERIFLCAREKRKTRNEMRETRRKCSRRRRNFEVDCIFERFSSPLGDSCDALDCSRFFIAFFCEKLMEI